MRKIIISASLTLIALIMMMPWLIGLYYRYCLQFTLKNLASQNIIKLDEYQFQLGWLTSHATIKFTVTEPHINEFYQHISKQSNQQPSFSISQQIYQGPLLHLSSTTWQFGKLAIYNKILFTQQTMQNLSPTLVKSPAIRLNILLKFTEDSFMTRIPSFLFENQTKHFAWQNQPFKIQYVNHYSWLNSLITQPSKQSLNIHLPYWHYQNNDIAISLSQFNLNILLQCAKLTDTQIDLTVDQYRNHQQNYDHVLLSSHLNNLTNSSLNNWLVVNNFSSLLAMFTQGTKLTINNLSFTSPQGKVKLSGYLHLPPTSVLLNDPFLAIIQANYLAQFSDAALVMEIPRNLLQNSLYNTLSLLASIKNVSNNFPSQDSLATINEHCLQILTALEKRGILRPQQDIYYANFSYQNGKFLLN